MGSKSDFPVINGHLDDRGTPYYHMVLNAGFLPNKKRNRMSASTGLLVKNNFRKASQIMNQTIADMSEARSKTGVMELKKLYELVNSYGIDGLPEQVDESVKPDNPLVSEVVQKWLKYADVGENTKIKYGYAAKHIIAHFDQLGIRIKDLDSEHIADYYTIKKNGNPDCNIKPLSAKTLCDHKTVIDGTIKYALKILKVIKANPSADVECPRPKLKSPTIFSSSQLNLVFEKIQGSTIEPAVIITANFGLRKQEVLGLKWGAINEENETITVRHTVTQVGKRHLCEDRTKTQKSLRTLPLNKQVLAYFKKLRAYQDAMKDMYGDRYVDNDYICKWPDGKQLRPGYVYYSWRAFLQDNNLPHITFHDLRHSSATMLHQLGFSIIEIQEWLGHADISSTKRYIHTGFADKKKIADKINTVLAIPG